MIFNRKIIKKIFNIKITKKIFKTKIIVQRNQTCDEYILKNQTQKKTIILKNNCDKPPPSISSYIPGTLVVDEVDTALKDSDFVLRQVRQNLQAALERMKLFANKHKSEREFQMGDWIGSILPASPILPPMSAGQVQWIPAKILNRGIFKRHNKPVTCWLIQWADLPAEDATWEDANDIQERFPFFQTEDRFFYRGRES
ncbi:hypothetical protein ACE6H2_020527 [Prunus campanulata]